MGFGRILLRALPLAFAVAAVSGCAGDRTAQPTFYDSMASPSATVDAEAAASMISSYRANNGLGAVTVDPALSSIALDRARTMADHDKIDRSAGREFDGRLAGAGFNPRGAVENVGAGYHTLAEAFSGWREFALAPREHAQARRQSSRHRRGLRAAIEIQGVLGPDHGEPRPGLSGAADVCAQIS